MREAILYFIIIIWENILYLLINDFTKNRICDHLFMQLKEKLIIVDPTGVS